MQHAVSSLEQDGIVECVSRRGTYVCPGWEHRLIRNHMVILKKGIFLPWQKGIRRPAGGRTPGTPACAQLLPRDVRIAGHPLPAGAPG
ncbi:MAG: hypothetical protein L6W00_00210 [Lentisphaeria bacterium]|nr:MAG: hypothetical protein L6W00_00210 [Lentisphaeria bacterium]